MSARLFAKCKSPAEVAEALRRAIPFLCGDGSVELVEVHHDPELTRQYQAMRRLGRPMPFSSSEVSWIAFRWAFHASHDRTRSYRWACDCGRVIVLHGVAVTGILVCRPCELAVRLVDRSAPAAATFGVEVDELGLALLPHHRS